MRQEKRIKAVIFDFDDTLIDWSTASISWREFITPKYANIHQYLADAGHNPPPAAELLPLFFSNVRAVWEESKPTWAGARLTDALWRSFATAGLDLNRINMDDVLHAFDWTPCPGVRPFDDAHAVLNELARQGYKLGLITNAFQPMWQRDIELREYGLLNYFPARITSGDTGFMKPHPAIYWRMLGMLHLMPYEAIFVGDRPENDILGAQNVGMPNVWMRPPHVDHDLNGIVPDYTVSCLSELLPILAALD